MRKYEKHNWTKIYVWACETLCVCELNDIRDRKPKLFSVCLKNRMLTFDNMLNPRLELMFQCTISWTSTMVWCSRVCLSWVLSTGSIMIVHVLYFLVSVFEVSRCIGFLAAMFWLLFVVFYFILFIFIFSSHSCTHLHFSRMNLTFTFHFALLCFG